MLVVILVGFGGAIGSVGRYLVTAWVQRRVRSAYPWGTYAVNASGSFLIGLVFGVFDVSTFSDDALVFLTAGLLGGYTTFSTFSVENLKLLEDSRFRWLLRNTISQVFVGLVLAAAGYRVGILLF